MAACLIADTHITEQSTYGKHKQQVAPLFAKFSGRFFVRGGPHEVLEGCWQPSRLVLIELPDMKAPKSWHGSPEYAPLLALRQPAATDHLVAVEGF